MALYWPDQKVALEIVDDPYSKPVDKATTQGWDVVQVTCDQVNDLHQMREIGGTLCQKLGVEPPEKTPEWLAANERLFNETQEYTRSFGY